ncbi:probable flavin-containing monoamine oxidase A, partial [Paramuricea clavata]
MMIVMMVIVMMIVMMANKLSKEISLDDSALSKSLDSQTLENFKQNHCWTKGAKELFDSGCGVVFGAHPSQISLLFFLHYCKCAGGVEPILESSYGSGQEWKIKDGAQTISHRLLQKIGEENVWLQEPVTEISQDNDEKIVVTTASGKKKISSKFLVMAIPPHQALRINFTPCLPFNKEHLLRHMPVGHLIKFIVTYATPFWRENGLSGEIVSFDDFKIFDKHAYENGVSSDENEDTSFVGEAPVSLIYDATSANGNAALVGFISGVAAARWTSQSEEEQKTGVTKFLKKFFGKQAESYLDFAIKDWSKEVWNGGCPVNYTTPGTLSVYGDCLKDPFGRIHWAGTETGTIWSGFMNGAVQAGTRAANEVLQKLYPNFIPIYQDKVVTKISQNSGKNYWNIGILSTLLLVAIFVGIGWF